MASKKLDFTQNTSKLQSTIAEATAEPTEKKPRKTYTDEETQAFLMQLKSTGRKGVKLPRINVAFAPDIYDYIKTMSIVTGKTLTEFVNIVLRQYMNDNMDLYEQAKKFRDSL